MERRTATMTIEKFFDESQQIIIENVTPELDAGRYAVKRVVGDRLTVQADIFRDGHDLVAGALKYRQTTETTWQEVLLESLGNDRWQAEFQVTSIGRYVYTIEAWNARFKTWQTDMKKRVEAQQVATVDVLEGVAIVENTRTRIKDAKELAHVDALLAAVKETPDPIEAGKLFLVEDLTKIMLAYPDRSRSAKYRELEVIVDPVRARYSAWYEFFPRSQSPDPTRSGTFQDCIKALPRVADLGFDVLYLPPIHPIGRNFRKGPNNTLDAGPNDPGSPWAIGNENGGHLAIEPSLGTFEDFDQLVKTASDLGIAVALDFAINASPDHPWVKAHPDWFFIRPDGTIKYAENPPKKYQDIYPINFYCKDREALWNELRDTVLFWCGHGIKVFRVDNPHTKSIPLWEWLIAEVKEKYPETIFLAEAFTRPKLMKSLGKSGFSQSYTYFTWRNARWELVEYLTELTQTDMKEYYRGNLWPNTPDILHEALQHGGIPAFKFRLVLAATLSSCYGIYSGYELGINAPVKPGSEEYLNSDKYQINHYDWTEPQYLGDYIRRVNQARHANPALQLYDNLRFYQNGTNDNIIVYGKQSADRKNNVLVVVNLDPNNVQDSWIGVPYWEWGFSEHESYQVHDLLTDQTYIWQGEYNYVRLDPHSQPAHLFVVTPTPGLLDA